VKAGRALTSREIIRALMAAGWQRVRVRGSHHQFRHPTRPGTVTVPHPRRDVALPTLISIERQSGVNLREL
jgi:predicted RNA binding protein YcfA (HicA-like mRNA interferase family)